jgi:HPt (histidine-containing phosphotransfer) domain-containing protein
MKKLLFDKEFLLKNFDGDLDILPEIINFYLNTYEEKITSLNTSIENEKYEEIINSSHKLRGSVSQFGVESLKIILLQIEKHGENKKNKEIQDLIPELEEGLNKLKSELIEFLGSDELKDL